MARKESTERPKHLKPFTNHVDLKSRKPRDQRYEIAYIAEPTLRVRVGITGKKSFIWRVRHHGGRKIVPIGEFPNLSIADAHIKLDDLKAKHKEGLLFNTSTNTPKTVSELCERFYEKRILPHRKRPDVVRQVLDADVVPWIGNRKLSMVTPIDITNLIEQVVERGATTHAGKVLATVKQLFKYAESNGYVERSPAYSHDPKNLGVTNNTRNRYLNSEEIAAFWLALDKAPRMSSPVRIAFRVLLLSGVRSGELRLAKWEHIDLEKKKWFIPEENSKTREWTVPLSSHLLKQFEALQGLSDGSEWVIPGMNGPVTDKVFGRAMRRLFELEVDGEKILTIPSASPHDLRRTMRSHMDDLRIEPHIAEKCLNHSLGRIAETYNKNQMLPQRREALEKWGDHVDLIVTPRENVRRLQA